MLSAIERAVRAAVGRTALASLVDRTGLGDPLRVALLLATRPRAGREELAVLRDAWAFRRRYGFLCHAPGGGKAAPTVLVVGLTNFIAQTKVEAMLAKALQLAGFAPVMVTTTGCRRAVRLYRAFGYRDIVFFDELLRAVPAEAVDREVDAVLERACGLQPLMDYVHRGVNVGRHVLGSVLHVFRKRAVDFDDPAVRVVLRDHLETGVRAVTAAERLLDAVKPEIVLLFERGFTPQGEIFDVAVNRGLNTIQWHHAHRSGALSLRRFNDADRHRSVFSISDDSWDALRRMEWTPRHDAELMEETRGRYAQGTWFNRKFLPRAPRLRTAPEIREQLRLDQDRKTAVVFTHVLWDITFTYGENLFSDYEEWLVETVKAACDNSAVTWIIKLHPDYVWKSKHLGDGAPPRSLHALTAKLGRLPDHIQVLPPDTDITASELYDVTDYCVTVRGTVGIEMACLGVPVLTAGTGRYSGLGFTVDSKTAEEYLDRLHRIQDLPPLSADETVLARKHAYGAFKLGPFPIETFEVTHLPLDQLGHPLDHNVAIHVRSFEELSRAADLRAFARWAVDPDRLDFVAIPGVR